MHTKYSDFLRLCGFIVAITALSMPSPGLGSGLCPSSCVCNDVELFVECTAGGLDVMPNTLNPGLTKIVYKNNDFMAVDVSLRFLPKLVTIDLSHNKIVSLRDEAFASQGLLTSLKLEGNRISHLGPRTFYGLKSLEALSLRKNLIEELGPGVLQHMPALQQLNLSRNRISLIHDDAFRGLSALRILNLNDNELPFIPSEALNQLPNLAELYLSGNPLLTVASKAFASFRDLSVLHLAGSRISHVKADAFQGLGTLRQLKMADNNLSTVPAAALGHVSNLLDLDLGRNPLVAIKSQDFSALRRLQVFDLSGCGNLRLIEADAFSGCVDLQRVSISLNRRLTYLSAQAFDASPNLNLLNLADNALPRLDVESMPLPWEKLRQLDLSGNPWRCDCDLMGLMALLAKRGANATAAAKCHLPPALRGQPLVRVESASLECDTNSDAEDVRHAPMDDPGADASSHNTTAVVISVAVVIVTLVVSLLLLLAFKCRHHARSWWRKFTGKGARHGHHIIRESPYRSSDAGGPANSVIGRVPVAVAASGGGGASDDEHYYYVATMQNRLASGKHIPVTEL